MTTDPTPHPSPPAPHHPRDIISTIQTDRFCENCGYNLHTQGVWRDPATDLIVTRCPECGRIHAAGETAPSTRRWQRRFTGALILIWFAFILFFVFALTMLQIGMITMVGAQHRSYVDFGHTQIEALRITTAIALVISFVEGLTLVTLTAAILYHWRTYARVLLALGWPGAIAGLLLWIYSFENAIYDSDRTALTIILGIAAVNAVGGLVASVFGRHIARGLATIFVPPGLRQTIVYLWLVDGLTPPEPPLRNRAPRTVPPTLVPNVQPPQEHQPRA